MDPFSGRKMCIRDRDKYAEVGKILDVISDVGDVKFKISGKVVTVYK